MREDINLFDINLTEELEKRKLEEAFFLNLKERYLKYLNDFNKNFFIVKELIIREKNAKLDLINSEIELSLEKLNDSKFIEESKEIRNYIDYLYYLKECLCQLFGHDVKERLNIASNLFRCSCCYSIVSEEELLNSVNKAPIKIYSSNSYSWDNNCLLTSEFNMDKLLPSYEEYQIKYNNHVKRLNK